MFLPNPKYHIVFDRSVAISAWPQGAVGFALAGYVLVEIFSVVVSFAHDVSAVVEFGMAVVVALVGNVVKLFL